MLRNTVIVTVKLNQLYRAVSQSEMSVFLSHVSETEEMSVQKQPIV